MAPKVEVTGVSAQRLSFPFPCETFSSADSIQAVGSGNRCDKGVAARGSPLDLGCFGWERGRLPRKKCWSRFQHLWLYCQLQYGVEHHCGAERGCTGLCEDDGRETEIRLSAHRLTDWWAYCSTRGLFIISLHCMANGWCGPFFSLTGGSITALICHPSLALMCESKTCCAY